MRGLLQSALACAVLVSACGGAETTDVHGPQYLGQLKLRDGATLDGTAIGGLSGLSYDRDGDLYYLISDDRSAKNPARFYTARITLSDSGVEDVDFVGTHPLLDADGKPFAPLNADARPPVVPPDPEGIAVDVGRQRIYWSSEGERQGEAMLDPSVRIADLDGGYLGEFTLPPMLHMSGEETGPRRNVGLEGLSLSPDGRHLWAAMEGPRYDDGELPSEADGALVRITKFDVETRAATAQYTYRVDAVASGPGGDNGLSELVAVDDDEFLVLERGYGTHVQARLYRVVIGDADDVLARPSLRDAPVQTMTKTLLVDLAGAVDPIDNLEGMTLGPTLPDGRQALVLVSDDNFSADQFTQFLAFAL
ncbi:esterase-like activity of phytase family protein [Mycolicibacterium holsaticum]|uniref:esterase-like activity of phytase family protein n=1 Tax=Mycolicibacterium holsaticum TaxID=152142 RepID=UPI001C7D0072|nr:esterase-like activity of phytase family protein [Mycolicibacterium holsaticum]MDA4108151.1 phytase [Mycolicibacterium holsaticum DSM 44478 = JCM 12374]QZA14439.1 esterase-like activity of phytase family protein [Mycolicibacterium holsaticum DSM 44478 = JCM 12374]UNC08111.1 esterase-like activity of phytase family protein [Mycolicibacterium holsaticum DSM 44478 = JCM 12374]